MMKLRMIILSYLRPSDNAIPNHQLLNQLGVVFRHVFPVCFFAHSWFAVAADGEAEELAFLDYWWW